MDLYGKIAENRQTPRNSCCTMGRPTQTAKSTSGRALNKILKDFVVKSRSMAGFDAPYVPGYDCHGLPIELRSSASSARSAATCRWPISARACRAYAERFIGVMTEEFKRLGVFGDRTIRTSR